MSRSRLDLHSVLTAICGNAYFQPPEKSKMDYPCIVYHRLGDDTRYADNNKYTNFKRYKLTIIDKDPDSSILEQIETLPLCVYDTSFTYDNLNHTVYLLYF